MLVRMELANGILIHTEILEEQKSGKFVRLDEMSVRGGLGMMKQSLLVLDNSQKAVCALTSRHLMSEKKLAGKNKKKNTMVDHNDLSENQTGTHIERLLEPQAITLDWMPLLARPKVRELVSVALQTSEALDTLHGLNIPHLNIHPGKISFLKGAATLPDSSLRCIDGNDKLLAQVLKKSLSSKVKYPLYFYSPCDISDDKSETHKRGKDKR